MMGQREGGPLKAYDLTDIHQIDGCLISDGMDGYYGYES